MPTTTGQTVSLADLRGSPVILYFNEGAGCGSCTQQMAEIEKNPGFGEAGITVLPIVMNTAAQIQPDLDLFGVTTPYLLDDGTVSQAYDTLGTGMHAGLPGHGFVLIAPDGTQLWQGEYPSMWLDPDDLLREATSRHHRLGVTYSCSSPERLRVALEHSSGPAPTGTHLPHAASTAAARVALCAIASRPLRCPG